MGMVRGHASINPESGDFFHNELSNEKVHLKKVI
jgi:hypothetical protein